MRSVEPVPPLAMSCFGSAMSFFSASVKLAQTNFWGSEAPDQHGWGPMAISAPRTRAGMGKPAMGEVAVTPMEMTTFPRANLGMPKAFCQLCRDK